MKWLCLIFCLSILISCREQDKKPLRPKISKAQFRIESLVDSFKQEYTQLNSESSKDSLVDKYNKKLFILLSSKGMDSILVHVDSVILKNRTVTTIFHFRKDISLKYGLRFIDTLTKKQDSLFCFMKNLIPGTDTLINFQYMGSHQFNAPSDTSNYTLRIFAFPTLFPSSKD